MWEKQRDILEYRIERSALGSYAVLMLKNPENLVGYQCEMLTNNKAEGILNFDVRIQNGITELWYDVSLYEPLKVYVQKNQIKVESFVAFLKSVCLTMLDTNKLFLEEKLFFLDTACIYVDGDMKPKLMYVPIKGAEQDPAATFKNIMAEITVFVELKQGTGDMIQALTRETVRPEFNFRGFYDKVRSFDTTSVPPPIPAESVNISMPPGRSPQGMRPEENMPPKRLEQGEKRQKQGAHDDLLKRNDELPCKKKGGRGAKEKKPKKSGSNPKLTVVLVQILLAVIFAGLYVNGLLAAFDTMQLGGLIVIALAVDYLIVKNLLDRLAKKEREEKSESSAKSKSKGREIKTSKPIKKQEEAVTTYSQTADSMNEGTVIMDVVQEQSAYLTDRNAGGRTIAITANPFIIGKSGQDADLVNTDKLISRRHVKIFSDKGQFFITDLGSTNGTLLNDSKLEAGLCYPLATGDRITLAKYEYGFGLE